jgi:hypothetical protein
MRHFEFAVQPLVFAAEGALVAAVRPCANQVAMPPSTTPTNSTPNITRNIGTPKPGILSVRPARRTG